jgi:hypothetical protein
MVAHFRFWHHRVTQNVNLELAITDSTGQAKVIGSLHLLNVFYLQ